MYLAEQAMIRIVKESNRDKRLKTKVLHIIYVVAGTVSLGIAILGILLPVLPATPFLLLTAALYIRSSEKLHTRLMNHRIVGQYIRNFQEQRGMPKKSKIIALLLMWTMIFISLIFTLETNILRLLIILLGLTGTGVILFYVKTIR